ncbi:MAG: ribosome maturation factor RimP [Oscillospiraceae bacterium]|jgi:ribosome maturation factor RimP
MAGSKNSTTAEKIFELALPLAEQLGLELWDVRFEKEGAQWYLRVFIDKESGVSIEDCEALTRPLNKLLDETDPIDMSYVFEVGSTGLGRKLIRPEHFEKFIGSPVTARLIRAVASLKEISGVLLNYNKITMAVEDEKGNITEIKLSDCAYVKLDDDKDLF